jgi:hypothetical protein
VRGRHRGARDGVGSAVAANPGRQNVNTRSSNVDDGTVVGEGGELPAGVNGGDSDGIRS